MVKTVLLVEDDPNHQALALRAFTKAGIANPIEVAHDGAAAIDILLRTGAHADRTDALPAVVLLDLKLPKVDGLEVLRRIRSHPATRLLPVVVLTTSVEEQDLVASYALGANSYIRKPVDFGQFIEAIAKLGLYWLVLNELPARAKPA